MDCFAEWDRIDKEFTELKKDFFEYTKQAEEVKSKQKKCVECVQHQKYNIDLLTKDFNALPRTPNSPEERKIDGILRKMSNRKEELRGIAELLPAANGLYLNIVLGNVNVSLLCKADKFAYKRDYENFKFRVTAISSFVTFLLYFVFRNRVLDAAFHSFLVWYYCTLTIRESILIVNGSRIKGWWRLHHFISTICVGLFLIWPTSESYDRFRDQFMLFCLYRNFVQCLQFYYQRNCLYKLRALGSRHNMDITVEGFMSWMNRSLFFLIPFNVLSYIFELYNSLVLYRTYQEDYCHEWHVLAISIIFFILAFGNSLTTILVMKQKIQTAHSVEYGVQLLSKYRSAANLQKISAEQ